MGNTDDSYDGQVEPSSIVRDGKQKLKPPTATSRSCLPWTPNTAVQEQFRAPTVAEEDNHLLVEVD